MSGVKFASITADLLPRKGEATPSTVLSSALFPFPQKDCANSSEHIFSQRTRNLSHCCDRTEKPRGVSVTLPPAEPGTIAYVAVKKDITREQLSRLTAEGCSNVLIVPVEVDPNADGSVTLILSNSAENFAYDASASEWVGDGGSVLTGSADLFYEPTGWCITITLHENQRPSVEIRRDGQCGAVRIDGLYATMLS